MLPWRHKSAKISGTVARALELLLRMLRRDVPRLPAENVAAWCETIVASAYYETGWHDRLLRDCLDQTQP